LVTDQTSENIREFLDGNVAAGNKGARSATRFLGWKRGKWVAVGVESAVVKDRITKGLIDGACNGKYNQQGKQR
jgi:hypothetical protein